MPLAADNPLVLNEYDRGPSQSHRTLYNPKQRSRREPVQSSDLGQQRRAKESKDSVESKESRDSRHHRRRTERERERLESSRHLFDPRRDDPMTFKNRTSNADSLDSKSIFSVQSATSTSTTTSVEDELEDKTRCLKMSYHDIVAREHAVADGHALMKAPEPTEEDWVGLMRLHDRLIDSYFSFLNYALDPELPQAVHELVRKYTILTRLWQKGYHQLLERMRLSFFDTNDATTLDALITFIEKGYAFYTVLYEDPVYAMYRVAWAEQLGDLSRYRMAVGGLAGRIAAPRPGAPTPPDLNTANLGLNHVMAGAQETGMSRPAAMVSRETLNQDAHDNASHKNMQLAQDTPTRHPNFPDTRRRPPSHPNSIGIAALNTWVYDDQETWRTLAREWYVRGTQEAPGSGRLHHHLGILAKGDDTRCLYHFCKSLCAVHPYTSAKESILSIFEETQDPFVRLHSMLFTRIGMDGFGAALEKYLASVEANPSELPGHRATQWGLVAAVNIAALLQYGADDGILRTALEKDRVEADQQRKRRKKSALPPTPHAIILNASTTTVNSTTDADTSAPLAAFAGAQRLAFGTLRILLESAAGDMTAGAGGPGDALGDASAYVTVMLTFLGFMAQHTHASRTLTRHVPWGALVAFLNRHSAALDMSDEPGTKITTGSIPEDVCIRGFEWASRGLYGRDFWRRQSALCAAPAEWVGDPEEWGGEASDATHRAARLAVVATWLVRGVPGFAYTASLDGGRFVVGSSLAHKIERWSADDVGEATWGMAGLSLDGRRSVGMSAVSSQSPRPASPVSPASADSAGSPGSSDVEFEPDDSEEIRELKLRRHHLKRMLADKMRRAWVPLRGYTVILFDTNVLLGYTHAVLDLFRQGTWNVVLPLAAVAELDGFARGAGRMQANATRLLSLLETQPRPQSLRIQTSRGNYIRDVKLRTETVELTDDGRTRTLDDAILNTALWQDTHFARPPPPGDKAYARVLLVTSDRNLRVKARARGIETCTFNDFLKAS